MTDLGIRIAAYALMAVVLVHTATILTALDRREWFKAGVFGGLLVLFLFTVAAFALIL